MSDTYIACAMTAMPPEEYESFRHAILDVCKAVADKGYVPYSEPFEVTSVDFDSPVEAVRKNIAVLERARLFVLVYTHKQGSSALIELGYALKRGIPIVVFAKEGVTLPFYLRADISSVVPQLSVYSFSSYQELPALVSRMIPVSGDSADSR